MSGDGARRRGRRPEMVPPAEFRSYYGRPILKEPTWKVADVGLYLFLGGMAGASATTAAAADLTGRHGLARVSRYAAAAGAMASVGALVHDLGRPTRFLNMLRVLKPTSPLSVGSWILAPFGTLATAAAASHLTGVFPRAGRAAGLGAGVLGPAMCTYTAVLLADTAIPAWHEARRELPFVFAGSALTSAGGAALLAAPLEEQAPVRRLVLAGACLEVAAATRIKRSRDVTAEPYQKGRPRTLINASRILTGVGVGLSLLGRRRSRVLSAVAGTSLLAGGACMRFGIFYAGRESARDPKYVVLPQRDRLARRAADAE